MKSISRALFLSFWGLIILGCESKTNKSEEETLPNILLIISDDQAYGDYSFMGHEYIETPRIDQLAANSLTFTKGYVTAPLCSPSLASIISGLYPHQHGITGNDPAFEYKGPKYRDSWPASRDSLFRPTINKFNQLPLLTKRLGALNYLSLQTGKWWMGSWEDAHFTHGMTHGDYKRGGRHGDEGLKIGRKGLDIIYDFMGEADSLDQPFFVWYAPFLPHTPHTPPADLLDKYLKVAPTEAIARYWAMCEWFDQTCGDLLDHLEEKGMDENTLVIYVADNGWIQRPDKPNRYAPRSKRSPFEGGIRTPLMFRWKGKITPRFDTTTLASSIDIVPTILAACGQEVGEDLPGLNVLQNKELKQRESIFAAAYEHDIQSLEEPNLSLQYRIALQGPWKLILPDPTNVKEEGTALYNLFEDPEEQLNLFKLNSSKASFLEKAINNWWLPEHMKNESGK